MRKENYLDKCTIFDKFVYDDIYQYSLNETSDRFSIDYANGDSFDIDIKLDYLTNLYNLNLFGEETREVNVWYPVFVWDDQYVQNKALTKEGSLGNENAFLTSGRLGIEEFINFKPLFQNWRICEEANFSVDWILNRAQFPYYLQYGLMYWYRRLPASDQLVSAGRYLYNTDSIFNFPDYSKLSTYYPLKDGTDLAGITLIKINNSTLYRVDKDDSVFTKNSIDFNSDGIISLSDFADTDVKFFLFSKESEHINDLLSRETPTQLFVPDGECFSYFENSADFNISYANNIPSKSYISPSLYRTYQQIYHILTLDNPKTLDSGMSLRDSRFVKKLAYLLSSSPIMTDFGINFLDDKDIRAYIKEQINSVNFTSTDSEILAISQTLTQIHLMLNALGLDNKMSPKTYNNNLITNRKQLFDKIIKKYGGYINIPEETECSLTYKNALSHGDNIHVQQLMSNFCKKDSAGTEAEAKKIYNNQSFSLNTISIETQINEEDTAIVMTKKTKGEQKIETLPLSDFVRNPIPKLDLNIVMKTTTNVDPVFRTSEAEPVDFWSPANYIFETQNLPFAAQNNETDIHFRIIDETAFNTTDEIEKIFSDPTEKITVLWERVYGACLKFTDTNLTPEYLGTRKNPAYSYDRYNKSTQFDPHVYVYKTGEYKIKCTINTPNGVFVKTKTFYVVVGTQKISEGPVLFYGHYTDIDENDPIAIWDYNSPDGQRNPIVLKLKPPPIDNLRVINEGTPTTIGAEYLKVVCPAMTDIAINKIGMFWPKKTQLSYANDELSSSLENYSLSGDDKFFFGEAGKEALINNSDSTLTLGYKSNNTKITISKIVLRNVRDETQECSQCMSFYTPAMTTYSANSVATTITDPITGQVDVVPAAKIVKSIRNSKYPQGSIAIRTLRKSPLADKIVKGPTVNFDYPQVSTKYGPKIKPFGGYDFSTVNKIDVNIPQSQQALPNLTYKDYPDTTGYRMDYLPDPIPGFSYDKTEMKVCYQKATNPGSSYIEFDKGSFHPSSGWIYSNNPYHSGVANLSSVLKFNPGARDTFSFTGPGLYGMKSFFDNDNNNRVSLYKSSIQLDISKDVQWDPLIGSCSPGPTQEEREAHRRQNQLNKEYSDQLTDNAQSMKHGYRYLEGGFLKLAEITRSNRESQNCDEFGFSTSTDSSCGGVGSSSLNAYTYSFPVTGPNYQINPNNIASGNFRDPRVNDFAIKDIEVKLNFLNYVNTKNLVVWLDVAFSATEAKSLAGNDTSAGQPIKASNEYVNQNFPSNTYGLLNQRYSTFTNITDENVQNNIKNNGTLDYLDKLVHMNSKDGSVHRIYLMNQDHVQNNGYNFSLKFSDHAPNQNTLNDENFSNSLGLHTNQRVINNEYEIQPTISASGYSDRESAVFKNVIRQNQLNILNNKFAKFKDRILFQTPPPDREKEPCQYDPTYDSSTTFTLNFAILDENEDMNVYDNVNNMELFSSYETGDNRLQSSDIYASLCSWELILHVDKTRKTEPTSYGGLNNYGSSSNSLSLIEYGKDPQYPGYGFIADLTGYENFIPSVNINAPNPTFYVPANVCDFANPTEKPRSDSLGAPEFPGWAINAIVMQFATTAASSGGTAVGISALLSASTFNSGYNAIFDFFRSSAIYREATEKLRNFYYPKYESYPFGSSEKVLLNVSKDGAFWYKLEAPIFRYNNTPVLEQTRYSFIRLNKDMMPMFTNWSFSTVNTARELIDESFIESIILENLADNCALGDPEKLLEYLFEKGLNKENTILNISFPNDCKDLSGLFIINNGKIHTISNEQENPILEPSNILYSDKFIQFNNTLRGSQSFITSADLQNKTIILDGKIPFYIFNVSNNVIAYSGNLDEEPVYAKVQKKYLIFTENSYRTVLVLDQQVADKSYVSLEDKDCLLVFKPQSTNILDYPISVWGFEKEKIKQGALEEHYSLNSVGSIGDGSYEVDKNVLDYVPSANIKNLYQIFNNTENDKLKYNNFTIIDTNEEQEEIINKTGAAGFAVDFKEVNSVFGSNMEVKTFSKSGTPDEVLSNILDSLYSVSNIHKQQAEIVILKCSDLIPTAQDNAENTDQQTVQTRPIDANYGNLLVEEDFTPKLNIKQLTQDTINDLHSRLKILETNDIDPATNPLVDFLGTQSYTDTIIEDGSIADLVSHYNELDDDDFSCLNPSNTNNSKCYKKRTRQALTNAYKERDSIIKVLQEQADKTYDENNNLSYVAKNTINALPHIDVIVEKYETSKYKIRSSKSLSIRYESLSNNYYWVNIDPKQSCSLASEMNPRVLTKTKYKCYYAYNDSKTFPVNNNVCPRFATGGGSIIGNIIDGISDIIFGPGESNDDEVVDAGGTEFTYSIPQETIDNQKKELESQYPEIVGWQTIEIDRVFTVNNDSDVAAAQGGIFIPIQDIIVEATETYEIAIPWHENNKTIPNNIRDDGSSDGIDLGDGTEENPVYKPRIGLATYTGSKQSKSTRVYNILNLDDTSKLKIQFRKIPRMIKGVDYRNTVYRYGVNGSVFRPIVGEVAPVEVSTDSSLNNLFYYWQCLQRNTKSEWKYTTTPDFFKILNEMEFRGFFGSSDYIEYKNPNLQSLYPWEIVPYEYDSSYE